MYFNVVFWCLRIFGGSYIMEVPQNGCFSTKNPTNLGRYHFEKVWKIVVFWCWMGFQCMLYIDCGMFAGFYRDLMGMSRVRSESILGFEGWPKKNDQNCLKDSMECMLFGGENTMISEKGFPMFSLRNQSIEFVAAPWTLISERRFARSLPQIQGAVPGTVGISNVQTTVSHDKSFKWKKPVRLGS